MGEQLVANDLQSQADYQLALQLSQETSNIPAPAAAPTPATPKAPPPAQTTSATVAALTPAPAKTSTAAPSPDTDDTPAPTPPARISFNGQSIAMAVPTDPSLLSEEERDRMIAMQLHQQEEKEM